MPKYKQLETKNTESKLIINRKNWTAKNPTISVLGSIQIEHFGSVSILAKNRPKPNHAHPKYFFNDFRALLYPLTLYSWLSKWPEQTRPTEGPTETGPDRPHSVRSSPGPMLPYSYISFYTHNNILYIFFFWLIISPHPNRSL